MEKEILYRGKRIFYQLIGNGAPVVLIHGFGEDGEIWKNQIGLLKHKFNLIIPDLPGSGKSQIIDDMSVEGMAEIIKSIIDTESPDILHPGGFRGALVGHSMGGYIALAFAEKYPACLTGFGLFH
jgi:pimeloyl-ACP methyl ester carboxylesterase